MFAQLLQTSLSFKPYVPRQIHWKEVVQNVITSVLFQIILKVSQLYQQYFKDGIPGIFQPHDGELIYTIYSIKMIAIKNTDNLFFCRSKTARC